MNLIADTGAIYALYDMDDRHHQSVYDFVKNNVGKIIIPSIILVEIDYLLREFLGVSAELDFIADVLDGAYQINTFTLEDLKRCEELISQYRDLDLGLADASVIITAEKLNIYHILTVDQRDFRAVKPKKKPFVLLPSDLPYLK